MPRHVTTVTDGRAAFDALAQVVHRVKAGDPLAPVTLLVPSNGIGVAARRSLGRASGPFGVGVAGLRILTLARLAEQLAGPSLAAAGRRPATAAVVAGATASALADEPGLFAPVAEHPSTVPALAESYRVLRHLAAQGPAAAAGALVRIAGRGPRAAEVVRLHREIHGRLHGWYDEIDLLVEAARLVAAGRAALGEYGPLVGFLLEGLRPAHQGLLDTLAEHHDVHLLEAGEAATAPVGAGDTEVVITLDADDEVRAAVRRVIAAAEAGTRLDRIAVLFCSEVPYARILADQLAGAGLPWHSLAGRRPNERLAGRTLLALLDLPSTGWGRAEVMGVVASAPLRDRDHRLVPATRWERWSREAGIVAGAGEWAERLALLAALRRARADELAADTADPDDPDGAGAAEARVEGLRRDADGIDRFARFVADLVEAVEAISSATRWADAAAATRWVLHRFLGPDWLRSSWPPVERAAALSVEAAVDRLGTLDAVAPPPSGDAFRRALEEELTAAPGRTGRLGEGVLVGPLSSAVGLDADLVVVLGLVEGSAPPSPRDDTLLPDADRRAAGPGRLPLATERVERATRAFRAALCAAPRRVLCLPQGDLRSGQVALPSRWIGELASHLEGTPVWPSELVHLERPWLTRLPSFSAAVRGDGVPAGAHEVRIAALLAAPGAVPAVARTDRRLAASLELVEARRSGRFGPWDGHVGPHPLLQLTAAVGATVLETWATCPFAYFVRQVLRVRPVEDPEELLSISPSTRGELLHRCLDVFVSRHLAAGTVPGPGERWSPAQRDELLALVVAEGEALAQRGLTGHPVLWARDRRRLLDAVNLWLDRDDLRRNELRATPIASELRFGSDPTGPREVVWTLPGDRTVRLRGSIDRVDLTADGQLVVVDYKTGRSDRYASISAAAPDAGGRYLQLPVYAAAAAQTFAGRPGVDPNRPVLAEYRFFPAKRAGASRPSDPIGFAVDGAVSARIDEVLAVVLDGIGAGRFPHRPPEADNPVFVECPACDPDGLGAADVRRRWETIRSDPALASYLAVVGVAVDDEAATDGVEAGRRSAAGHGDGDG